jgi:hypothetical protein
LLTASHGWQTLIGALIAAVVAIAVALLAGGEGAGRGRGGDGATEPDFESVVTRPTADVSISLNSITEQRVAGHDTRVIVILQGEYDGFEDGWTIYALARNAKGNSEIASVNGISWSVQKAIVDKKEKTWVAKFTVNNPPQEITWSAGLVREGKNGSHEVACSVEGFHCSVIEPEQELRESGPASELIEAAAPQKTTVVNLPQSSS